MKIKYILLALMVLIGGCGKNATPATPNAVWFFGDSITLGLGATVQQNRWTSKLSTLKGWAEDNMGVSGESLSQGAEISPYGSLFARYKTAITKKPTDAKYIFFSYGGADCSNTFSDYTPALFSTQLQTIITYANSQGWANSNIVVLCGYFENDASWPVLGMMPRYNSFITAAQTVAQNNAGVYFVNPFNTYNATEMSDNVHPNDAGYAAIANYVASQIP